jgi:hypothetical protein
VRKGQLEVGVMPDSCLAKPFLERKRYGRGGSERRIDVTMTLWVNRGRSWHGTALMSGLRRLAYY